MTRLVRLTAVPIVVGALAVPLQLTGQSEPGQDRPGNEPAHTTYGVGASSTEADRTVGNPGFLFQRPTFSLTLRGGGFFPRAQGQFFEFAVDEFTLDRGDFRGLSGGGDLGVWITERIEVMGSVDLASVTRQSHYPTDQWVELTPQGDEIPIRQTTRLRQGPVVTAGAKFYPLPRGESLSQFVWVPSQVAPYLSGGVGGLAWNLDMWGDFVDESDVADDGTFGIVTAEFTSDGFSFASFAGVGVDITLTPRISLNVDSRYLWSEGEMDQDFQEFTRPLDLSGVRLTSGFSFRF